MPYDGGLDELGDFYAALSVFKDELFFELFLSLLGVCKGGCSSTYVDGVCVEQCDHVRVVISRTGLLCSRHWTKLLRCGVVLLGESS